MILALPSLHFQRLGEAIEAVRLGPSDGNLQYSSLAMFTFHVLMSKSLYSTTFLRSLQCRETLH